VIAEAPLERSEAGLYPAGEGWFVVNVRDVRWFESEGLGRYVSFESENIRFAELGIGIGILQPGEPNCMYHAEDAQEDFLVLSGECLLVVEGQERRLRAWDFVHCPPWTKHVFVGVGDGPCVVIGVGARKKGRGLVFPVDEAALRHGAGVEVETRVAVEAYARYPEDVPIPCPEVFPG
jgi:uncharacterized cupin superfamily protein